jgi:hypothetical protein
MNELGLLWSKFHLVLYTKMVRYVVKIMLTKIHNIFISVPRIVAKLVQFSL